MTEREEIQSYIDLFRASTLLFWIRLREVASERGIDVSTSLLARSHQDDENFEFGIIVTNDRRVIQYGYSYTKPSADDRELTEWKDLTQRWVSSPYSPEVSTAFSMLDKIA